MSSLDSSRDDIIPIQDKSSIDKFIDLKIVKILRNEAMYRKLLVHEKYGFK